MNQDDKRKTRYTKVHTQGTEANEMHLNNILSNGNFYKNSSGAL